MDMLKALIAPEAEYIEPFCRDYVRDSAPQPVDASLEVQVFRFREVAHDRRPVVDGRDEQVAEESWMRVEEGKTELVPIDDGELGRSLDQVADQAAAGGVLSLEVLEVLDVVEVRRLEVLGSHGSTPHCGIRRGNQAGPRAMERMVGSM